MNTCLTWAGALNIIRRELGTWKVIQFLIYRKLEDLGFHINWERFNGGVPDNTMGYPILESGFVRVLKGD